MKQEPNMNAPDTATVSKGSAGALAFQIFCALIFLGMIGMVFANAMLRYCFNSGYPPSEEWARFLFIYITFFGAIEAFYHKKHIAVDMVLDLLHGVSKKTVMIVAHLCTIFALCVLLQVLRTPASAFVREEKQPELIAAEALAESGHGHETNIEMKQQ